MKFLLHTLTIGAIIAGAMLLDTDKLLGQDGKTAFTKHVEQCPVCSDNRRNVYDCIVARNLKEKND